MQTEEQKTHYACSGECSGSSDGAPETCGSDACSKKGQKFVECHCADSAHKEVKTS